MTIETTREGLIRLEQHLEQLRVAFQEQFARIYASQQQPTQEGDSDYYEPRK